MSESEPVRSSESIQRRLNRQRQLLAALRRSDALTRGDITTALSELTELAAEVLRVERSSVWRFDRLRQSIQCVDMFSVPQREHASGDVITREQAPHYFTALTSERCIAAHDAHSDPRTSEFSADYLTKHGIGALLDAPVFVGGEMAGVVCMEHVGSKRHWEFWEELVAGTLADFVALVIEASERVRAERELGLYKTHMQELSHLRTSELRKLNDELSWDEEAPTSELETRRMFDASPVPLVVLEPDDAGLIVYANRRAAALLDVEMDRLVGSSAYEFFVNADERSSVVQALQSRGRVENFAVRLRTRKNWPFWALLSAQRTLYSGRECSVLGLSDITAQKVAEAAVRRSERSVRALFAAAPVAMVLTNQREMKVILANQRAADLFGVPIDQVEGQRPYDFYQNGDDRDEFVRQVNLHGRVDGYELKLRTREGKDFWGLVSASNIEFEGDPALMTGISDITEQKVLEGQLRELATRDFLTGAYNRRHFLELCELEIGRIRRSGKPLSVCMIDIDFFKQLNDTRGHAAGDEALRVLAATCRTSLRTSDIFARYGGEEFVMLYPETTLEGAWTVTERVRDSIAAQQIQLPGGGVTSITVSAGLAELAPGENVEGLLRRADDALYKAKSSGRNRAVAG
ncbi:MAG TPA: diguanylate cyclase [Polyangiaceae bacterium]|nr:diguanylate cyclase [Polyangiaceae bacterium]